MCDPVSISTALAVVGTATSFQASRNQATFQEGVGRFNARNQENAAVERRNQGTEAINAERTEAAQLISTQRAIQAARGGDVGSGTNLALQQDTQLVSDINVSRIRRNAEAGAGALETQAQLTRSEAAGKATGTRNAGLGNLITSAGAVSSKWYSKTSAGSTPATPTVKPYNPNDFNFTI